VRERKQEQVSWWPHLLEQFLCPFSQADCLPHSQLDQLKPPAFQLCSARAPLLGSMAKEHYTGAETRRGVRLLFARASCKKYIAVLGILVGL